MRDLNNVLIEAKKRPLFTTQKIESLIGSIKKSEKNVILHWDDGAGEDWIQFSCKDYGVVYMIHKIIPVNFVRKSYYQDVQFDFSNSCDVVLVDNYDVEEWCVDLEKLKQLTPEMVWHSFESDISSKKFSLVDLYLATV